MTIKASYPTIEPTLNLDFANSKRLDPRVTFTRNSVGTYFDAAGVLRTAAVNEPRFDHDPATGESLGLLVEESRTNLLLRSEEFDNASWSKVNASITQNAAVSPTGTLTADKLAEDTATSTHTCTQSFSGLTDNTFHSFSVYAKQAERSVLALVIRTKAGGFPAAYYNLVNGTFSNVSAGITASIVAAGNGWYRCTASLDIGAGASTPTLFILPSTAAGIQNYPGDGTSGIYIWGAQLEAGAFPTSYIKTEGTTITRQADTAVMTGTNFSSWYRQSGGVLYASGSRSAPISSNIVGIDDGTLSNRFNMRQDANTAMTAILAVSGATEAAPYASAAESLKRGAIGYAVNNFNIAANGNIGTVDTSSSIPALTTLTIGGVGGPGNYNGQIRAIRYWNTRLPDATLQALTAA